MSYLCGFFFLIAGSSVFAQTIQVPDNCINRVSPCLIRTEDNFFRFVHDDRQVMIMKEAVVKISFDNNKNNFEVIEGRISLNKQGKSQKLLLINNRPVREGRLLVSRFSDNLHILDLSDFVLSEYRQESDAATPGFSRSEFINKKDFIVFTKDYFHSTDHFKKFLVSMAPKWKFEFDKQNNSQTKVLLRTIASEQEKSRIEAKKNADEAHKLKKVRDEFFYRTFRR